MEIIGIGVGKSQFTGISLVSVSAKIWSIVNKRFYSIFSDVLDHWHSVDKIAGSFEFKPIDGMLSHHARRIYLVIFFCFLIENN
jgi:hypothetical protein